MERYKLSEIYLTPTDLITPLGVYLTGSGMNMGLTTLQVGETLSFIVNTCYGLFYDDYIAYSGEDSTEVKNIFQKRFFYDVAIKLPYWYRKYQYVKKVLTDSDLTLFQTSKMTSSSSDTTKSAGGTLQKTATTPTGVSATGSTDAINIDIKSGTSDGDNDIETDGFADKYSNAQQKFANATRVEGSREGTILREGSLDELLNVLEKLPASLGSEICKDLGKHFIFDYE